MVCEAMGMFTGVNTFRSDTADHKRHDGDRIKKRNRLTNIKNKLQYKWEIPQRPLWAGGIYERSC